MASGSVPITAGSGTPIRVVYNAAVDSGAYQQVFTLADANGNLLPTDPDGTLQTSPEASGLFLDDFSGTLSTRWTAAGTTAPVTTSGVLTTNNSANASATSYMRTIGTFALRAGSYLGASFHIRHETGAVTGNTRAWGLGLYGTPTASVPITNGAVFELWNGDGALYATTYNAGVRGTPVALTRRTDGNYHKYEIVYRQSTIYWLIDGVTVSTQTFPNLAVADNLAAVVVSANAGTASASPQLNVSSVSVRDLSSTNKTISDGTDPWIQATVKRGSISTLSSDTALVVDLRSGIPSGTNTIGNIQLISGSVTPGTSATHLGKARSGTPVSVQPGVATLGVRAPTTPAALASAVGLYSPMLVDAEGKVIIAGTADPVNSWQSAVSVASTSATALRAAGGTGLRNYITDLVITSTSATATVVTIQDGATAMGVYAVSSSSPVSINLGTPLRGTAATAVNISASAANQIYVSATGYTGI